MTEPTPHPCLYCQGSGTRRVWNNKDSEFQEMRCTYCEQKGYYPQYVHLGKRGGYQLEPLCGSEGPNYVTNDQDQVDCPECLARIGSPDPGEWMDARFEYLFREFMKNKPVELYQYARMGERVNLDLLIAGEPYALAPVLTILEHNWKLFQWFALWVKEHHPMDIISLSTRYAVGFVDEILSSLLDEAKKDRIR